MKIEKKEKIKNPYKTIEEFIEELEKIKVDFQAYCHAESCDKDVWEFPLNHKECSKKFDLDTAIAWYIGVMIFNFILMVSRLIYEKEKNIGEIILNSLNDWDSSLFNFYDTIKLTGEKYRELLNICIFLIETIHKYHNKFKKIKERIEK